MENEELQKSLLSVTLNEADFFVAEFEKNIRSKVPVWLGLAEQVEANLILRPVHARPVHTVCPVSPRIVGETSSGYTWGSSNLKKSSLIFLFVSFLYG